METKPTNVEELFYKLKDYGDTRLDLFKLKGINKVSGFLSSLITSVILVVLLFLVLICLTVGIALVLGNWLGEASYGFFLMGIVYIIIGLILFKRKDKTLKTPISNRLIKDLMD
jgi:hypothetical protein